MRIYTKRGDLAFKTFDFPDGQPHFKLETHDEINTVTVEARIKNPDELMMVCLAADALRSHYDVVNLDVRYLMGARMDRRISDDEPFTLNIVANMLNPWFDKYRILDVHSDHALGLFHVSSVVNVLPFHVVEQVTSTLGEDLTIVIPDKGAKKRVHSLIPSANNPHVQILKVREMATGKITGMDIENPKDVGSRCLIVDDICDGGRTFIEAAKLLRAAGAKEVYLYVTHGIFSGKLPLEGIDRIFTTDSYYNWQTVPHCTITCIPVSMKEM